MVVSNDRIYWRRWAGTGDTGTIRYIYHDNGDCYSQLFTLHPPFTLMKTALVWPLTWLHVFREPSERGGKLSHKRQNCEQNRNNKMP